jgi:hypothetical protein
MAVKDKQKISKEDVGTLPMQDDNQNGKTALALIPPTSLLAPLAPNEAEAAFLADSEELPSGPTKLPTIAINHKDGEFVLPDGQTAESITGFIIAHITTRTYYEKGFDPKAEKAPPDCRSSDCIVPDANVLHKQSADCATCKQNVFGSEKTRGKGKACKEYVRLFVVNPEFGNPPIAIVTLPPSGISLFYGGQMVIGGKRGYLDQLKSKHRAWQIVWSRIGLRRESDDATHCVPTFEMGETATLDVAKALAAINNQFVDVIKKIRHESPEVPQERQPGEEG